MADSTSMPPSPSTRSVRFSHCSEMVIFPPPSGGSKLFSSRENRRLERAARLQVARDASQIMATMLVESVVSQETLCKSVGIEKLIWPPEGGARRAMESRRDHVRAVVSRQYICTAEELCRLSQDSSRMERKTAQTLAATHWNVKA